MVFINRIIPNAKVFIFPSETSLPSNLTHKKKKKKQFIPTPAAELNEFLIDSCAANRIGTPQNFIQVVLKNNIIFFPQMTYGKARITGGPGKEICFVSGLGKKKKARRLKLSIRMG